MKEAESRVFEKQVAYIETQVNTLLKQQEPSSGGYRGWELEVDPTLLKHWEGRPEDQIVRESDLDRCILYIQTKEKDGEVISKMINLSRLHREIPSRIYKPGEELIDWSYTLEIRKGEKPNLYSHIDRVTVEENGASGALISSSDKAPTMEDLEIFSKYLSFTSTKYHKIEGFSFNNLLSPEEMTEWNEEQERRAAELGRWNPFRRKPKSPKIRPTQA